MLGMLVMVEMLGVDWGPGMSSPSPRRSDTHPPGWKGKRGRWRCSHGQADDKRGLETSLIEIKRIIAGGLLQRRISSDGIRAGGRRIDTLARNQWRIPILVCFITTVIKLGITNLSSQTLPFAMTASKLDTCHQNAPMPKQTKARSCVVSECQDNCSIAWLFHDYSKGERRRGCGGR